MGEGTVFSLFVSPHLGRRGVPQSGLGGRAPHSRFGQVGGYPIPGLAPPPQTWDGVPPRPGMGSPQTWDGVPPDLGWGTPQTWDRVPPWTWDRVPPPDLGWGTPPSIASTCYVVGGMPLAFMQEDFLVLLWFAYTSYMQTTWYSKSKTIPRHFFA